MSIAIRARRTGRVAAVLAVASLGLAACSSGSSSDSTTDSASAGSATGTISVWAHQGQPAEVTALQNAVDGFNSSQTDVTAELKLIPEADYTRSVAAASADELPDVIEIDGPNVASMVYDQKIQPVDGFVSPETLSNQSKSIQAQNTVDGKVYTISQFNAALGMAGNKKLLDAAGVEYPTGVDDPWTAEEFTAALEALSKNAKDGKVLTIKESYGLTGEWATFGFSPIVWSAGGNLLQDNKADGYLNKPEVAAAMKTFQGWKDYIDGDPSDSNFNDGKLALSWFGHWMYPDYSKALGKDLVVMPLPDFGNGIKTGQGSWTWGVSAKSESGPAAGKFLDYLANDENVAAMTEANGAPPATTSAFASSPLYKEGGPLNLFSQQLEASCGTTPSAECIAVSRPVTAGYPIVTESFATAFDEIYKGADAQEALNKAAAAIDTDFSDNDNYQP